MHAGVEQVFDSDVHGDRCIFRTQVGRRAACDELDFLVVGDVARPRPQKRADGKVKHPASTFPLHLRVSRPSALFWGARTSHISHNQKIQLDRKAALRPTCVSEDTSITMNITVKDLLDAGVHFGHQTRRWNPRSKPYIFDHRQGVSIIDLGKTYEALQQACDFVENLVADGRVVLLVGTKRQAQDIVRERRRRPGCLLRQPLAGRHADQLCDDQTLRCQI